MGQQSSWGAKGRETGYLNLSHPEAATSGAWPLQDESDQGKPQGLFTSYFCSHCFNQNWSRDSKEAGKGGFLEVLKGKEAMFWWTLFLPHYHCVLRRHKDSSSTQAKTTAWIPAMCRHHARHWWFPETSLTDCIPNGALLSWEDRKLFFFFKLIPEYKLKEQRFFKNVFHDIPRRCYRLKILNLSHINIDNDLWSATY